MRRALKLTFTDGTTKEFDLERFTMLSTPVEKVGMHIDKLPGGKYRIICSENFIQDFSRLKSIEVVREGG